MLRIFSVKNKNFGYADEAKYVILFIKPNKMMGSSYANTAPQAKKVQDQLRNNGSFKMVQVLAADDHDAIEEWKERARKNGYFTSYKEAKEAGAIK